MKFDAQNLKNHNLHDKMNAKFEFSIRRGLQRRQNARLHLLFLCISDSSHRPSLRNNGKVGPEEIGPPLLPAQHPTTSNQLLSFPLFLLLLASPVYQTYLTYNANSAHIIPRGASSQKCMHTIPFGML